jgi:hypothetical protein
MSVPKSRRGESPAEYINLAREIYVFTYNRVRILPKSYTFYFPCRSTTRRERLIA